MEKTNQVLQLVLDLLTDLYASRGNIDQAEDRKWAAGKLAKIKELIAPQPANNGMELTLPPQQCGAVLLTVHGDRTNFRHGYWKR